MGFIVGLLFSKFLIASETLYVTHAVKNDKPNKDEGCKKKRKLQIWKTTIKEHYPRDDNPKGLYLPIWLHAYLWDTMIYETNSAE